MIEIAREVADALGGAAPVVALETTLVAHGFPAGEGVAVGLEASGASARRARSPPRSGSSTAVRVGLSEAELERFTAEARKVGPRDLAACVVQEPSARPRSAARLPPAARPGSASWRPAGSAACTAASGMDVSADLGELARTEALVVSLGRQVAARRRRDGGAAGDARRAGARLPHGRAAALLYRRRRAARPGAGRERRGGGEGRARALAAGRPPALVLAQAAAGEPRRRGAADRAGARRRRRAGRHRARR